MIEGQNAGDDAKWLPDGEVDRIWSDGDRSTFHLRHQPGEIVDERGCHMGVGRQFPDRVAAIESIELRQFLCILANACRYFAQQPGTLRSEGRRSGRVCVRTCRSRWETAYEVRSSDWSSDGCSSDLTTPNGCLTEKLTASGPTGTEAPFISVSSPEK